MIPSIAEILQRVRDLVITPEEAQALIDQHIALEVIAAADRDGFAMAALDGFASTGTRYADKLAMAREAYAVADAMVAVRLEVRP